MATATVSMGQVKSHDVFVSGTIQTETVTSFGTAASTTATANLGDIAKVYCDTAVYVNGTQTVTAANGLYVPASIPTYIAMTEGKPLSVIDA